MIHIRDLYFSYPSKGKNSFALRISELNLKAGEKVFIYGPSGSGKSTFLEIVSGVLLANQGQVEINGQNLAQLSNSGRDHFRGQNMGIIFQNFNLIPYLSARENICLQSEWMGEAIDDKRFSHIAEQLEIHELLEQSASSLSVGQQQRVALARVLLKKPKVILADEPTSALDYERRESFLKLLMQIAAESNSVVLFVSHDLSLKPLFEKHLSILDFRA